MPPFPAAPHGGVLVHGFAGAERAAALRAALRDCPSWTLAESQAVNLELILNGSYSPLRGFMRRADAEACAAGARLADGLAWPEPVTLAVTAQAAAAIPPEGRLALRDPEGRALAVLAVAERWAAADAVLLGGEVEGLEAASHYDFVELRRSPAEIRAEMSRRGWRAALAVPAGRPLHRADLEDVRRHAETLAAGVLLLIMEERRGPADRSRYARVRALQAWGAHLPADRLIVAMLPAADTRDPHARAALAAIVARNFGCTHLAVETGTPADGGGETARAVEAAGIGVVPIGPGCDAVGAPRAAPRLAPDEVDARLDRGEPLPAGFTFPEVDAALRRTRPSGARRGVTVFFTGLSGAGKSTIANALRVRLLEAGREVSLLDGDLVRQHLSSELGFSRAHRELNVRRIAFVAAEVTRHGGIAICAPIAPYDDVRRQARAIVEAAGAFALVYVDTPLEVCEARDPKGLYARARAGLVPEFTGVSDPYEVPEAPDLTVDATGGSPADAVDRIVAWLERGRLL